MTSAFKAALRDLFVRAGKTFAQTAAATIVAAHVVGLFDVNFMNVLSVAGLAALLSILMNIGGPVAARKADKLDPDGE